MPVEKALANYYQTAAEAKAMLARTKEMFREAGYTSDADLARIVEIVKKYRVSANVVLRDRRQSVGAIAALSPMHRCRRAARRKATS